MLVSDRCDRAANAGALRPVVPGSDASGDADAPWMLSVIRLGRAHDVDAIDWATALRVEHGARLVVITVWLPIWWQFAPWTACADAIRELGRARHEADLWSRGVAERAGAERVIVSSGRSAARAVTQELDRHPYSFVVGTRAAVSRRAAQRWMARTPALSVFRV